MLYLYQSVFTVSRGFKMDRKQLVAIVYKALVRVVGELRDEYYHGSSDPNLKEIKVDGLFDGIFAHCDRGVADSHGNHIYKLELSTNEIAESRDLDNPAVVKQVLQKQTKWNGDDGAYDLLEDLVVWDKNAFDLAREDEVILISALGYSDLGEISWELQRIRGQIAKQLGYKAVRMSDEHGSSILVFPPTALVKEVY